VEVCALSALCALCVEVCALSALCVEVCALSALCDPRSIGLRAEDWKTCPRGLAFSAHARPTARLGRWGEHGTRPISSCL
jgi:hypothetical protein